MTRAPLATAAHAIEPALPATVAALGLPEVTARLRGPGLRVCTGPFVAALRSPLPEVASAVWRLYGGHALAGESAFTDWTVSVRRPAGLRRWWQPQVTFGVDGSEPFNPLPGGQGFPLLEWGLNWCVYGTCHQYLILHAAVLERHGRALLLPAPSGSGKSTLCAALLFDGWRLLSDELALLDPHDRQVVPNPRPVSLKNASIDVLAQRVPGLAFGSRVHETSKGVVAHFAAPAESLARAGERARPGWVVLPRYLAGSPLQLQPLERAQALVELVGNAFNHDLFGAEGFALLGDWVDASRCFRLTYSALDEALGGLRALADGALPA